MDKMYHIALDDSHGARYAILPGDPGRDDLGFFGTQSAVYKILLHVHHN